MCLLQTCLRKASKMPKKNIKDPQSKGIISSSAWWRKKIFNESTFPPKSDIIDTIQIMGLGKKKRISFASNMAIFWGTNSLDFRLVGVLGFGLSFILKFRKKPWPGPWSQAINLHQCLVVFSKEEWRELDELLSTEVNGWTKKKCEKPGFQWLFLVPHKKALNRW